jgi:hypothetical protein
MTIDLFFLSFGLLCCHQRKGRKRESIAEQASLSDQSPGGIAFIGPGRLGAALPVGLLPKAAFRPILLPRSQRVAILYVRRLGSACSSSSKMHQLSLSRSPNYIFIWFRLQGRLRRKRTPWYNHTYACQRLHVHRTRICTVLLGISKLVWIVRKYCSRQRPAAPSIYIW